VYEGYSYIICGGLSLVRLHISGISDDVISRYKADFMAAEEKARVAVSSRGSTSAAAEGLRTPPA